MRLLIGESAFTYQYRSPVPVKPGSSARTGAPFAKARIAPAAPTPTPRSALPAITGCSVSPAPCVPNASSVSPSFLKMPTWLPSVGGWFSQLLIWPIATLSVSSANAGDAASASGAVSASPQIR